MLYPKTKALQPVVWLIHHVATAAQSGSGAFVEAEARQTLLFSYLGGHLIKHIRATELNFPFMSRRHCLCAN